MTDIDFVYLWVNGNDPVWAAKRDACIGKPTGDQAHCKGRYVDNGELKYSLRSVEKYAPWIRRIFIVTDNQVPEWLDTTNPRVQIVDHTEIMPAECLPCFNSALIELFLHKIPGLSENFLYANDDMFLNKPVTPQTFFHTDGKPYLFLSRKRFRKLFLFFREKILRKTIKPNVQTIRNASLLVEKKYGKYYGAKPHHNIDAYQKSTLAKLMDDCKEEFRPMLSSRMRQPHDIQRIFFSLGALACKLGHANFVTHSHSFHLLIDEHDAYEKFERANPTFFCMNDSERANDDDRRMAMEFVQKLFPAKSSFEK